MRTTTRFEKVLEPTKASMGYSGGEILSKKTSSWSVFVGSGRSNVYGYDNLAFTVTVHLGVISLHLDVFDTSPAEYHALKDLVNAKDYAGILDFTIKQFADAVPDMIAASFECGAEGGKKAMQQSFRELVGLVG